MRTLPGFSAEAAIHSRASSRIRGGRLGFSCDWLGCTCSGVDDCIDLWVNTDLCSGSIICYGQGDFAYCYCVRK